VPGAEPDDEAAEYERDRGGDRDLVEGSAAGGGGVGRGWDCRGEEHSFRGNYPCIGKCNID
jgi:hypothetical protein